MFLSVGYWSDIYCVFSIFADKEHVSVCRILVDGGILPELYYLLTTKTENQDKIAELVAEVAKVGE